MRPLVAIILAFLSAAEDVDPATSDPATTSWAEEQAEAAAGMDDESPDETPKRISRQPSSTTLPSKRKRKASNMTKGMDESEARPSKADSAFREGARVHRRRIPRKEVAEHFGVEAWFINMAEQKERARCMKYQLGTFDFTSVNRWEAAMYPEKCRFKPFHLHQPLGGFNYDAPCLRAEGWSDCLGRGVTKSFNGVTKILMSHVFHNIAPAVIMKRQYSNYCSHSRLFRSLSEKPNTAKQADYVIIFEDDVSLSENFLPWLRSTIRTMASGAEFQGKSNNWDVLLVDVFSSTNESSRPLLTRKETINGNTYISKFYKVLLALGVGSKRQGRHPAFGFHAVLFKRAAFARIIKCLDSTGVVPIDWIGRTCDAYADFWAVVVDPHVAPQGAMQLTHAEVALLNKHRAGNGSVDCPEQGFETSIR